MYWISWTTKLINHIDYNSFHDDLTFEVKINVLSVAVQQRRRGPNRRRYDHRGRPIDNDSYFYVSRPLSKKTNTLRFLWNIPDINKVDWNHDKGIKQYHSDIYYDMLQLQMGRDNAFSFLRIMITGFPENVFQIGYQFEIFAIYKNSKQRKTRIASNITSLSYNSPLFQISTEKANKLFDLLQKYKSLSILCHANIIQKYDQFGDYAQSVSTETYQQQESMMHAEQYLEKDEEESIMDNMPFADKQEAVQYQGKWIDYPSERFLWKITDINVLREIKSNNFRVYHSNIFELLDKKWFLAIQKTRYYNRDSEYDSEREISALSIYMGCVLEKKESMTCKIELKILELINREPYKRPSGDCKVVYYDTFRANELGYRRMQFYHGDSPSSNMLLINQSRIKRLESLSIDVKITKINLMSHINDRDEPNNDDINGNMEIKMNSNRCSDIRMIFAISCLVLIIAILLVKN